MVERGELWWADLGAPRGSAPALRRPVLVVSADSFNSSAIDTVTVVAVTTNTSLVRGRGNVFLAAGIGGLLQDSVANVTQMATLDKSELEERLGVLPHHLMTRVDSGLRLALGL